MRLVTSGFLVLVLSGTAAGQDEKALLEAELHDAINRQQEDLRAREDALTEQTETAKELLQLQQQYIEQLEAQIRALQQPPDSHD